MRAVVLEGTRRVAVEDVDDPGIERATDCVVRITSAAICGSDLHMYEGRTGALRAGEEKMPGVTCGKVVRKPQLRPGQAAASP